jgi:hypothetical protein
MHRVIVGGLFKPRDSDGDLCSPGVKKTERNAPLWNLCIEDLHYGAVTICRCPARRSDGMTDKVYLVRFKPPEVGTQLVVAERVQIHGEHVAFLNSKGELAALFLLEVVEGWSELSE